LVASGVWRAPKGFKTVFGRIDWGWATRAGLAPPAGAGAVQLAWGGAGEMTNSAVICFGWEMLDAGGVGERFFRAGAGIQAGTNTESGLRACFFYFRRRVERGFRYGIEWLNDRNGSTWATG